MEDKHFLALTLMAYGYTLSQAVKKSQPSSQKDSALLLGMVQYYYGLSLI